MTGFQVITLRVLLILLRSCQVTDIKFMILIFECLKYLLIALLKILFCRIVTLCWCWADCLAVFLVILVFWLDWYALYLCK